VVGNRVLSGGKLIAESLAPLCGQAGSLLLILEEVFYFQRRKLYFILEQKYFQILW
jgi:hypothetical protein